VPLRIVQLGTPRLPDEGLRIGTVRRPPRGVPKSEIARRDFYDAWLPELAPSPFLLAWVHAEPVTPKRWGEFRRKYDREMHQPTARHLIAMLAALSHHTSLSVGCYCADESQCHRSALRELLVAAGAAVE
jgi:uncharacterized protein YeaO (DUF488 family)